MSRPDLITPRQLRVLELISRGYTDVAIASLLGITRNTVKNHKRMIFEHLDVHSAAAAVAVAYQEGLLAIGDCPSCGQGVAGGYARRVTAPDGRDAWSHPECATG